MYIQHEVCVTFVACLPVHFPRASRLVELADVLAISISSATMQLTLNSRILVGHKNGHSPLLASEAFHAWRLSCVTVQQRLFKTLERSFEVLIYGCFMRTLPICVLWTMPVRYLVLTNQTTIEFHINMSNGHAARRKGEVYRRTCVTLELPQRKHLPLDKQITDRNQNTCFCLWFLPLCNSIFCGLCFRNPYDLGWSRNFQEVQSGVTLDCSVSL